MTNGETQHTVKIRDLSVYDSKGLRWNIGVCRVPYRPLLLARHTARSLSLTLSYSASFCTMAETSDWGGSFPTLSPPEARCVPLGGQPPPPASRAELQHAHLTKKRNVTNN